MRGFRQRYGDSPLNLLASLASFALAGAAAWSLLQSRTLAVTAWFVGAAVLHDVVLVPLYALAERGLRASGHRRYWINHVRVPAAVSALLLLVWLPSIARLSDVYTATTGLSSADYVVRWLAVSGILFLLSALHLALRHRRVRDGASEDH